MTQPKSTFPDAFTWGAAAASYQIEGAVEADGRGPSIWDMLCAQPDRIYSGHSGAIACDHYHRYREDVQLMQSIGLQAYRFSIAWPRIFPEGTGALNDKGLDFYDRLVDALLAAGIQPWATLFHWDFPYALFCQGGWLNPRAPEWFADYTAAVVKRLSDRVQHWMTLNEPQVFLDLGHRVGRHAPGLKYGNAETLRAIHHALLAHGRAVQTIREHAVKPPSIGWAPVGSGCAPASDAPADVDIARKLTLSVDPKTFWNTTWYSDPVFFGRYPEDGLKAYGKAVPQFTEGEMQTIAQPMDFYGVNIYTCPVVRAAPDGAAEFVKDVPGSPATLFNWQLRPQSLYWIPRFLFEHYKTPMVITENGLSNPDWVALDGKVHDPQRIDFLQRYLREVRRAINDGTDIRAYFQWSIMDNFEWAEGYQHRFGLIHVDYPSQKRTLKDSALWYRDVIRSNGGTL